MLTWITTELALAAHLLSALIILAACVWITMWAASVYARLYNSFFPTKPANVCKCGKTLGD